MRFFAAGLTLFFYASCFAFDTGAHADITREALTSFRFSSYAVKMVQLENWLVDYFSNTGDFQAELGHLHFDNLTTTTEVRIYWGYFTNNSRRALEDAARANDPFTALALLGMQFHALQDFYTHSNWVETHPQRGRGYRTESWFDAYPPATVNNIRTGSYPNSDPILATDHGDYTLGMNHDSYSRPRYDEAYVFAYFATRQWIVAVQKWVEAIRPGFFKQMQSYDDAASRANLDRDMDYYAYRISTWIYVLPPLGAFADGHWKGLGSGNAGLWGLAVGLWKATADDIFVDQIKVHKLHRQLIVNLDNLTGIVPAIQPLPKLVADKRVVLVKTVSCKDPAAGTIFDPTLDPGISPIDADGLADFYGVITIGSLRFVEAAQRSQVNPFPDWVSIKIINSTTKTVDIKYELWDEDASVIPPVVDDDHCDINPAANNRDLRFTFTVANHNCAGDINGVFDSLAKAVTLTGTESKRAIVSFYVTEKPCEVTPAQGVGK